MRVLGASMGYPAFTPSYVKTVFGLAPSASLVCYVPAVWKA
jgi:hypothetical protein